MENLASGAGDAWRDGDHRVTGHGCGQWMLRILPIAIVKRERDETFAVEVDTGEYVLLDKWRLRGGVRFVKPPPR